MQNTLFNKKKSSSVINLKSDDILYDFNMNN